jgi:hypothetical protein
VGNVPVKWAYGVTTVPRRRDTYLPRTLDCLKSGGFNTPRLFIDGGGDSDSWEREFGLEVTLHGGKPVRAFGNWVCALWELWCRDPEADRFAIFQDDVLCPKNLRWYLDRYELDQNEHVYWNLFTFPPPRQVPKPHPTFTGFTRSDQMGRGALALVFPRGAVIDLLGCRFMADRVNSRNGHRNIDGKVVDSLRPLGYEERVHFPSLVQHVGDESTLGNVYGGAPDFPGMNFDCLSLPGEGHELAAGAMAR